MESVEIASDIPISHHLHLTEFVGYGMYTVYLVVAVVVLLNVLIAMMSTTYGKIEQNAETEWMVARTSLMTQYMCGNVGTLPPPFNLIPSINDIIYFSRKLYHLYRLRTSNSAPKKDEKKVNEGQQQYQVLIGILTARYVRTKQAENARRKQTDKITEELNNLKRTVERLSNGLFEIKV
ncbi:short transient receptor potential channel 2-like [Amphiura filiformis]|uniref:short transient receptor potential channel 2-like n=1 Tax=Amphiura filiformis TaxID=82378 RepID=UPI003B20DF3F